MALTTSEMTPADIAAVTCGGNYGNNGFGDDSGWWVILFLILAMGGNWGNGFGGNGGGGYAPWLMNTDNDVERGFDQLATTNALSGLQASVSNGFANTATQLCNGFAGVEAGANARQIANMNQNFGMQTAMMQGFNNIGSQFADCCCENRLANCQTQNIIQNEGNATRFADANNTRDILTALNGGIQSIKDQLCADKIDAKNDEISQLRQEVLYARGQASQVAQNAAIINGVYNRLNECPVGTVPVYGEQPIFTCPTTANNCGCGCGSF